MKTLKERFYEKFIVRPNTRCWVWVGSRHRSGYGVMRIRGDAISTHRVSWMLHNEFLPPAMDVLHKCDRPGCVNPDHLFLGTQADNNLDRDMKGRGGSLKGSTNHFARLTEDKVRSIRASVGKTLAELSLSFGTSENNIRFILNRQTWRHVE